ncbi:MAG: hypothetical protein EAX86_04375 [Candidatus Heimdallarchaeota archaeon]|nr:hypothetical protein [Candidatus Heimdallarchaeota archaeon]
MNKKILFGVGILTLIILLQSMPASSAVTVESVKWHPAVKEDAVYSWSIDTINASGETSWDWGWANNVTLKQGEKITLEWTADPDEETAIATLGPIIYTGIVTKVGSHTMNFTAGETTFNFLQVPVYIRNDPTGLNALEAGLNSLERLWINSFGLPTGASSADRRWSIGMHGATLLNTGENGTKGETIIGEISGGTPAQHYVFDIEYDSVTGFVTSLKYPSAGNPDDPTIPIANSTFGIVSGLDELVITFDGEMKDVYAEAEWGKAKAAPGFEAPIAIITLVMFGALIRKRKK